MKHKIERISFSKKSKRAFFFKEVSPWKRGTTIQNFQRFGWILEIIFVNGVLHIYPDFKAQNADEYSHHHYTHPHPGWVEVGIPPPLVQGTAR